jgi:thioesterase domain-containing protein
LKNIPREPGLDGNDMKDACPPVIVLSGSGGGVPDLDAFRNGANDKTRFEVIGYHGWQRYVADQFSPEVLIADLAAEIATKVGDGPIRIIGISMGGHVGYAIALHLQAIGREIASICAIDSFMVTSSEPSAGWQGRALEQALDLLRGGRIGEFVRFLRSKFWRALARLAGGRLSLLLSFGQSRLLSHFDPIFEQEVSMRLLVRKLAPWIGALDQNPIALKSSAVLLRTRLTASDDAAWQRRCPNIRICEIPGRHDTLFEADNVAALREAFLAATADWR